MNAGSGSTAETVAFSYGPDRKRWQQMYTGNGTNETTNYVGGLMEVVSSGSTTTYRHYIYAGGEPVAVYARSSAGTTFRYTLSDHQGSVSDFTYSSGSSVVNESFTPFGLRRNPTTWSGAASNSDLTTAAGITRQGYTFQTQLGLWMGMNHMNGRVEDAVTGRMLSADALIPDGANPQSYNRYTYGYNNPLTNTDPSGFCTPAWACKQDAGSGLGKCRVCGGSDPGDAGFNNLAMQQFAAISADPDQGFLAGLDDIASSLANPIDQSRGCLIGCPSATVDLTPPTTCAPGPENGGQGICTVTVCAHCQAPIDLSPFPTGIPSVASLTGQQPQTVPQGDQNQQQPCTGLAGAIVDLTGGESNQSFVDDVVNNFVDTNDSIASTATKTGLSLVGGGTAAAAYYGTTPFQAIGLAWSAYNSSVRIPGLIGSATPLQLFSTAAATWAINSVLIKGSYDAGVLAGSILRTGANRLATATCGRGP